MADLIKLKKEISEDPLGLGYSSMSNSQVIESLNSETRDILTPVPSTEMLAWSAGNSRFTKIQSAALGNTFPDSIKSIANAALLLIERDGTSLDLSLPDRLGMLNALVMSGVLSQQDKDDLFSIATKKISRSTEIGLGDVGEGDVIYVRAN